MEFDFESKLFAEGAIEEKGRKNGAGGKFLFACSKVGLKTQPENRERVSFGMNRSFWYISDWQSSHGADFYGGRFYAN